MDKNLNKSKIMFQNIYKKSNDRFNLAFSTIQHFEKEKFVFKVRFIHIEIIFSWSEINIQ